MANQYALTFDDSKEIEMICDFNKTQILKVNTDNSNIFLDAGKAFDVECLKRVDEKGRIRIIYVIDKIPPLTAVLKFVSTPFVEVEWGIYAVIVPNDSETLNKIIPIVSYGLGITNLHGKLTVKVFNSTHRDDLTKVMEWMDSKMDTREPKIETKF